MSSNRAKHLLSTDLSNTFTVDTVHSTLPHAPLADTVVLEKSNNWQILLEKQ